MKFNSAATSTESTMVRYFEESIIPFIKAKIRQDITQLDGYDKLVAKIIKAETSNQVFTYEKSISISLKILTG